MCDYNRGLGDRSRVVQDGTDCRHPTTHSRRGPSWVHAWTRDLPRLPNSKVRCHEASALEGFVDILDNRLTDYEEAEIAIRIHAPGEPVPAPTSTNGAPKLDVAQYRSVNGTTTYRKSRRLRNGKSRVQRRRFVIKKSTTVKEIKMMVGYPSLPHPTPLRLIHLLSSCPGL